MPLGPEKPIRDASPPDRVFALTAHNSISPVHQFSRAAAVSPSAVVLIVQWFTIKIAAAISDAPTTIAIFPS